MSNKTNFFNQQKDNTEVIDIINILKNSFDNNYYSGRKIIDDQIFVGCIETDVLDNDFEMILFHPDEIGSRYVIKKIVNNIYPVLIPHAVREVNVSFDD